MLSCHKKNADAADAAAALHMHKDKTKKVARLQLFGHAATVAEQLQLLLPVTHSLTHDLHVCQCWRSVEPQLLGPNEAPQVMSSLFTEGVVQLGQHKRLSMRFSNVDKFVWRQAGCLEVLRMVRYYQVH